MEPLPVDAEFVLQDSQNLLSSPTEHVSSDGANDTVVGDAPISESEDLNEGGIHANKTAVWV
jgi:hypothetical protein